MHIRFMDSSNDKENGIVEDKEQDELYAPRTAIGMIGVFFLELVKIVLLAGITIFIVRHFIFKPFYVKGQSMEPNYFESEYLIIDQVSYRFAEPERGDVIVFRPPTGVKDFYLKSDQGGLRVPPLACAHRRGDHGKDRDGIR